MSSVIKVAGGETIQIRTGVLQGIGPIGPMGATGNQGPQGDQGPQGETGPMGAISGFSSYGTANSLSINAGLNNVVTWTAVRDELGVVTNGTTYTLPGAMDIVVSGYLSFNKPAGTAGGLRGVELVLTSGATVSTFSQTYLPAVGNDKTSISFWGTVRGLQGDTVQVQAYNGDSVTITMASGRFSMYRAGSGPVGPAGPAGAQGPQGPTGSTGSQGPAGNANSGFTTYESLRA